MTATVELKLRATWHLGNGLATNPTRVLRYAVEGMPHAEEAEVAELPARGQWSILRRGKWSETTYESPEAALSALQKEVAAAS
jgi:hypothetical protein